MNISTCPDRDQLSAYLLGNVPEEAAEALGQHLESCADCQATVTELEGVGDTLVDGLRQLTEAAVMEQESNCADALARAAAVGYTRGDERSEATTPSSDHVGGRLRDYELLEELGAGGMGTVYKARHARLDRVVALKVLPQERTRDQRALARFDREMKAVARCEHANIVRAFDAGEHEGTHYLVMEYVDGLDLSQLVKRVGNRGKGSGFGVQGSGKDKPAGNGVPSGPRGVPPVGEGRAAISEDGLPSPSRKGGDGLGRPSSPPARPNRIPIPDACELVRQAAAGLQCAHEHGLVHRDIKPSNLMLTAAGQVKVLDLGLALLLAEQPGGEELTGTSQMMGTADYCAPEQAGDSHTVDIRADIYSLGCTLYKLLTGHAPFASDLYNTTMKKLIAHTTLPVPSIRSERPDVPEGLAQVLDRMLAKSPADRYATPAEVLTAIAPYTSGSDLKQLFLDASQPVEPVIAPATISETPPHLSSALTGTHPSAEALPGEGALLPLPPHPQAGTRGRGEGGLQRPAASHPAYDDAPTETYIARRPPRRGLLIAAAAAALVLVTGIVIIVRNKDGHIISKTEVPDDTIVDVEDASGKKLASTTALVKPTEAIKQDRTEPKPAADASLITAFDLLQRSDIPPYELSVAALSEDRLAPKELVAIFGDSRMKHWNWVLSLAMAVDGNTVMSGANDGTVRVWDRLTGRQQRIWTFSHPVVSIALSPDGKQLAVGKEEDQFCLIELLSGERREAQAGQPPGNFVAWTPDGDLLASSSATGDGAVMLWDPKTGNAIKHLGDYGDVVPHLVFDPSGKTLVSASRDGNIKVWDVEGRVERHSFKGGNGLISAVAFDRDGRLLVGNVSSRVLMRYETSTGNVLGNIEMKTMAIGLATALAGDRIAAAGWHIETFDRRTGKPLQQTLDGDSDNAETCIAATDNGLNFATGKPDGRLRMWHAESADQPFKPETGPVAIRAMAITPRGTQIAAAIYGSTATIWDVAKGGEARTFETAPDIRCIAISPDGATVATGHYEVDSVRLWNAVTGKQQAQLGGNTERICALAFSNDGRRLAAADVSGLTKIWDAGTGAEVSSIKEPSFAMQLAFSPDGKLIAGACQDALKLWDVESGEPRRTIAQRVTLHAVAFSLDGSELLVTAGENVTVFDVQTGEARRTLAHGARSWPYSIAVSPDGKTIATGAADGKVRLWNPDPPRGKSALKRTIEIGPPGGLVRQVHFTPDGRHLVTLNGNGTIYVLRLEEAAPAALAANQCAKSNAKANPRTGAPVAAQVPSPEGTWPADAPPPAIAPFDAEHAKTHQEQWADYLKLPQEYTNSVGMKFVLIPPGEFTMGSTPEEVEAALKQSASDTRGLECFKTDTPRHSVVLTRPFYLAVHEVTQKEYETVMGKNPSHFAKTGPDGNLPEHVAGIDTAKHPVEQVSWNDAAEFCAKLSKQEELQPFYFRAGETVTPLKGNGYRLPTEAEWEFACRAGTTTRFWSGDKDQDLVAGWVLINSGGRTHEVEELSANPFGLFDVHGNVWEWVEDAWEPTFYSRFVDKQAVNPSYPFYASSLHVMRGGSWGNLAVACRSLHRHTPDAPYQSDTMGFRVALVATSERPEAIIKREPRQLKQPQDVFASLRREDIPPYELSVAALGDDKPAPKELVGIIGDSRMKHWFDVTSVAWTPDEKTVVSGGNDGAVRFWDPSTGRLQMDTAFHGGLNFPARVETVALSPDGKTLAVGGDITGVGIYEMGSGAHRGSLTGGSFGSILEWSPDGTLLASASPGSDGTVDLWDPFAREHRRHVGAHASPVRSLAFNRSGDLLASASDDGVVKVWDAKTGAERRSLIEPNGDAGGLVFDPDGRLVVANPQQLAIHRYDPLSGELLQTLAGKTFYYRVVAGLSSDQIAGIGYGIDILDQETGELRRHFDFASNLWGPAARSTDGRLLAVGSRDGFLCHWNVETGKLGFEHRGHQAKTNSIAISSDGAAIASASDDGTVRIWDPSTGRERLVLRPEQGWVRAVNYSPDGRFVVAAVGYPHLVRLWDATTGEIRGELLHGSPIISLALSADGTTVVSGSSDGTIKLWDLTTGKERQTFKTHETGVGALALSADGQHLATATDGTGNIALWDTNTGKQSRLLSGHTAGVTSLCFSPDGRTLASTGSYLDGTLRVWDVVTGEELRALRDNMPLVDYATFSADGKTIATGSGDGKVRLWDPDPPRGKSALKRTIPIGPPRGLVKQVHFAPDGRHLVTLNGNGTIYVLRLEE